MRRDACAYSFLCVSGCTVLIEHCRCPRLCPSLILLLSSFFFFALLNALGRLVSVLFFSFLLSMFLFFFVPLLTEALHDCVEATSRSSFSSCFLSFFFLNLKKKNAPFPPCFALADICFSSLLFFQCMIYLVAFFLRFFFTLLRKIEN